VINLAAQAGVRYSFTHPDAYVGSNITGFLNILEACRHHPVEHLVFASSSSVYGLNKMMPFSVHAPVDHPVSLYAASKKSNELMAHSYSHLFGIPVTGLRFFTVYGPWGRPDMSLFLFVKAILEGRPINVHNEGRMERDFTYISDIVRGVVKVLEFPAKPAEGKGEEMDPATSSAPYRIYNIGNSKPVKLMEFISAIEENLGKKAITNMIPMQPGEVEKTWADVSDLEKEFNYAPDTPITKGVRDFVEWYRGYFQV
jgi:UDP-glucuronate 4-epimerase